MGNDANNSLVGARLTYYIFEGVLVGTAGGRLIHLLALLGGGGARDLKKVDRKKTLVDPQLVNNPYTTWHKEVDQKSKHLHGGAIPLGRYTIDSPSKTAREHKKFVELVKQAAFLRPDNKRMTRSGFYIHGRGGHGSDGCIVPLDGFNQLMNALEVDGRGILHVQEAMGGSRFA